MAVTYHRMSRRRRSELSDNPEAVLHGVIGTEYRHHFIREAGDEAFRAEMTDSILTRPTASSQDPASLYLFATFWMKQPAYLLIRTSEMEAHFEQTAPYQHYWWTAKTLGDCQTILVNSADKTFPRDDQSPLIVGRDQHSHWTYIKWTDEAERWLDTFAAACHALGRIKIDYQRRHVPWSFRFPSGIGPVVEHMVEGKLTNYTFDLNEEARKWVRPEGEHRFGHMTRQEAAIADPLLRELRASE